MPHRQTPANEAISSSIQGLGDLLGNALLIGGLGGSIDTLLKPIYEDVIAAWMSTTSPQRAQNAGWSRYFEYFQDGANKAYTIASLMVLRAGFWSTRTVLANEMKCLDGSPYFVGAKGHYFLDDRIGFMLENDPTGKIWVDRARKIELKWDAESYPEWVPTIGDPRNLQDPAQRAWGRIESMVAALRDIGVYAAVLIAGFAAAATAFTIAGDGAGSASAVAFGGVNVVSGEFMPAQTMRAGMPGALDFIAVNPAGPAHATTSGADVSVFRGERVAAQTVSFSGVSVTSVPNLVDGVFALGSPGEVL